MTAPGFSAPVEDAQRVFRSILDATAHPGRIVTLPATPDSSPLGPGAAAIALALVDGDTPVWLAPSFEAATPWLRFHCGAPVTRLPAAAMFAFARNDDALPPLDEFALGSDAYPDRSTTLVVEVPLLEGGGDLRLSGPGIDGMAKIAVGGLGSRLWQQRAALRPLFPCGIDLVLVCGTRMAALPRTTRVEG